MNSTNYLRLLAFLLLMIPGTSIAQVRPVAGSRALAVQLPADQRARYGNTDGSCVQCSIGMLGVDQNVEAAATLLWKSEYGRAERGGSGPPRVAAYLRTRGISAWNITGNTTPWIEWALHTGRGVAVTYGKKHMVTAVGMTPDRQHFAICDNRRPTKIVWLSRSEFYRMHAASGRWAVVLDAPPSPGTPAIVPWWR